MMPLQRVLILACSARKRDDPQPMPALQRYDGIFHRVLRRWLHTAETSQKESLAIFILSAEFGLIEATTLIPYYDRKMDKARAQELAPRVVAELRARLQSASPCEVFLAMGKVYRLALMPVNQWLPPSAMLYIASGGIGQQAAQLREWLYRWSKHSKASSEPQG